MYRIGLFSKISQTTIKTLHHYDELGLLKPQRVDEVNGYRYYTSDQLFKLHEIISLQQMGFALAEISAILNGHNVANILKQR